MHIQSVVRDESELHCRQISSYCRCRSTKARDVVYIVDTDFQTRQAVSNLSSLIDLEVVSFDSPQQFLAYTREDESSCLILELCRHDQEKFHLQCRLAAEAFPPVIFTCGHGDVSSAVRALKSGAIEVLTTPINSIDLAEALLTAFALDRRQRRERAKQDELRKRHALLTPREREVLPLVVEGLMNKQAADVLGISETTLQIHRSQVMRKMKAESVPKLIRMAAALEIPLWRDSDTDDVKDYPDLHVMTMLRRRSA
ncbi:response regulator transcription factor [Granulicella sp. L60]|uniref:response regulator transcription factor n=1 Tax=Granulicella sp. L60 TaxID=1641866 RepID=UPI00131DBD11|nr:LuxR C-terminal-related transcriptional regulator [Granulicella sp. L60]